ncbi:hypothetical protein ACFQ12_25780 [Methylobacterium trifolii]
MRKDLTVFAALVAASLVATPLVMGAGKALATPEEPVSVSRTVEILPVTVAPVAAPAAMAEPCARKVRVVYSGYGTPDAACIR